MGDILETLINNLDKQIKNLEELQQLLTAQRKSLVYDDVNSLKENMNLQNRLITRTKNLEKDRISLLKNISNELGLEDNELRLIDICNSVGPAYSKRLMELRGDLINSLEKLKELRNQNEALIKRSMEIVNDTMKIFYYTDDRGKPSYDAAGVRPSFNTESNLALNRVV